MSWFKVYADYERHRKAVEDAAARNPYPFSSWFDKSGRAYVPLTAAAPSPLSKDDKMIVEILAEAGYAADDDSYRKGYATSGKRTVRIGKLLRQYVENEKKNIAAQLARLGAPDGKPTGNIETDADVAELAETSKFLDTLLPSFENSPARKNIDKSGLTVVISQLPHDVGSMSTGRSWTSCMNLDSGQHKDDLYCEIAAGSLVAYLVKDDDTEIGHPLGRIHVKRFVGEAGSLAIPEETVYGTDSPELVDAFTQTVKRWIDSKQGTPQTGIYRRVGGKWTDSLGDERVHFASAREAADMYLDPPTTWRVEVHPDLSRDDGEGIETEVFASREEAESAAANQFDYDETWRDYYGGEWNEPDEDGNYPEPYTVTSKIDSGVRQRALEYVAEHLQELGDDIIRQIYGTIPKYAGGEIRKKLEERLGIEREVADTRTEKQKHRELRKEFDSADSTEKDARRKELARLAMEAVADADKQQEAVKLEDDLNYENNLSEALYLVDGIYDADHPMPQELVRLLAATAEALPAKAESFGQTTRQKMGLIDKQSLTNRITAYILHVFAKNGEHGPDVLSFCRKIPPMIAAMPPEKEATADNLTHAFMWELRELGNQAREFIPFLKERMQALKTAYSPQTGRNGIAERIRKLYHDYAYALQAAER
jgi:hypothetical protein